MTNPPTTGSLRSIDPSRPLRVGIAGAGLMGFWHAANIAAAGGRLVAVADPDGASARRIGGRHRGVKLFTDSRQMLADCHLDVLHVCTPLPTHLAIAELGVDAGVDLLIEKPLAATAAETKRLLDLAASRNLLACPVHQFGFQPGVLEARARQSRIGRIVQIAAVFHSAGGEGAPAGSLDAIVTDILPHPLSIMLLFIHGALPAARWLTTRPSPGEFSATGDTQGTMLSIRVSMSARPTECSFRIVGTEGTIHLDCFHGFGFIEPGGVSRSRKITRPFDVASRQFWAASLNLARRVVRSEAAYPGLRALMAEFYAAVRVRSAPPVSPQEAMCVAELRDRLSGPAGRPAYEHGQPGP